MSFRRPCCKQAASQPIHEYCSVQSVLHCNSRSTPLSNQRFPTEKKNSLIEGGRAGVRLAGFLARPSGKGREALKRKGGRTPSKKRRSRHAGDSMVVHIIRSGRGSSKALAAPQSWSHHDDVRVHFRQKQRLVSPRLLLRLQQRRVTYVVACGFR